MDTHVHLQIPAAADSHLPKSSVDLHHAVESLIDAARVIFLQKFQSVLDVHYPVPEKHPEKFKLSMPVQELYELPQTYEFRRQPAIFLPEFLVFSPQRFLCCFGMIDVADGRID